MHIYVGGLPEDVADEKLRTMFEEFGVVRSAVVVVDKKTGKSQGYGFVEMPVKHEGRNAIEGLRMKDLGAGPLRVKLLKPGDEFHQHAMNRGMAAGAGSGKTLYRGEPGPRGAGAIRRGGKRGS
jgi:RNA recognition motif-containing protein